MVIVDESSRLKFTKQEYSSLKSKSLESGKLFVDELFPANDNSLFRRSRRINGIVWKRPHVCALANIPYVYLKIGNIFKCYFYF
jgi:hypothetical protein